MGEKEKKLFTISELKKSGTCPKCGRLTFGFPHMEAKSMEKRIGNALDEVGKHDDRLIYRATKNWVRRICENCGWRGPWRKFAETETGDAT